MLIYFRIIVFDCLFFLRLLFLCPDNPSEVFGEFFFSLDFFIAVLIPTTAPVATAATATAPTATFPGFSFANVLNFDHPLSCGGVLSADFFCKAVGREAEEE